MATRWYVLNSKPRKERVLWQQLQDQGYEVFYPHVHMQSGKLGTKRYKPFFPGYLFVKVNLDIESQSTFQWMPFAIGLVSMGGKPAFVPEKLVQAIQSHLEKINNLGGKYPKATPAIGNTQEIESSWEDFEAFLDGQMPDNERVRSLFKFLQRLSAAPSVRMP